MAKRPGGMLVQQTDDATKSQLFPLLTMAPALFRKGLALPALATLAAFLALYTGDVRTVLITIGLYFSFLGFYAIYAMCGRAKPMMSLLLVMLFQVAFKYVLFYPMIRLYYGLINSYIFNFSNIELPAANFITKLLNLLVSVGPVEESTKILPVALLALLTWRLLVRGRMPAPIQAPAKGQQRRSWIGRRAADVRDGLLVAEPLDGIIFGAVSALCFAVLETSDYIRQSWFHASSHVIDLINSTDYDALRSSIDNADALTKKEFGALVGKLQDQSSALSGLLNAVLRTIDTAFTHVAWTGIAGYGVGLAVLRPKSAVKIVALCGLLAIFLHSLFDAVLMQYGADPWTQAIGATMVLLCSYAILASMILKARQISPNRATNFATVVLTPKAASAPSPRPVVTPAPVRPTGGFALRTATGSLALYPGTRLTAGQLTGADDRRLVAEVRRNPNNDRILGLTNMTAAAWTAVLPGGNQIQIEPQQSMRLLAGCRLTIEGVDATVAPR